MTPFSSLIQSLAAATNLPLETDAQDSCTLETDGLLITLQYRREHDDVALFAPVTDPGAELSPETFRTALALSCHGEGTKGNFLGLFHNALVLSTFAPLEGLTAETLGARILAFADAAISVRDALDAPAPAAEPAASGSADLSAIRV